LSNGLPVRVAADVVIVGSGTQYAADTLQLSCFRHSVKSHDKKQRFYEPAAPDVVN
jgi:hypothetical protein